MQKNGVNIDFLLEESKSLLFFNIFHATKSYLYSTISIESRKNPRDLLS